MFQSFIRRSAVGLFGIVARLGLDRLPGLNRIFLSSYSIYKQYFEAGPIDRLREFVPFDSMVIDVGANVGFFSLRFAKWVGDGGKVIAIEPEDRNYDSLISALRRANLLHRVEALKAAASAEAAMTFLEINPLHPADHKLSQDGTGLVVSAVALDDLVQDRSRLSLIKIDVQGAEMLVLEGAAGILKACRLALFVELHEEGLKKFGTSVTAVLAYLSCYGYEGHWLVRRGPPKKASPAEIHARIVRLGYVDVLFLKSSFGTVL
jgi:FkbM family methyltransferase